MYDELVKRLREVEEMLKMAQFKEAAILIEQAADAIEELIPFKTQVEKGMGLLDKADELLNAVKPRWIPVTERLPKENGFYLCLYKHKASGGVAMDEGLSILQWINNKWGINDIYLVTHWLPLPEPPEEG